MKISISVITLFSLITAFCARAEPFAATDAEYRQLPPYCLAKVKGSNSYTPWVSYFGGPENAMHMHHYCDCLRFQTRALRNPAERKYNYQIAADGCEYVLIHARPDFFMRSEILTQKAKALMGAGDEVHAASSLIKAIEFNAKYVPAYVALADYFVKLKNQKQALEHLEQGLANAPENKTLRRRYIELGGKKPLPELPTKPEPTPVADTPQETKASDPLSPVEIRSQREAPSTEKVIPQNPAAEAAETAKAAAATPKIGSPKNPYCRFCTD